MDGENIAFLFGVSGQNGDLVYVVIFTPVYNFINDRLVDESAVLRPLS